MSKGIKLVSTGEFRRICNNFDTYKKTEAVQRSRRVVRNRKDKRIYETLSDTPAPQGMTYRAIGVDGFSVAENVPVERSVAERWADQNKEQK